MDKYILKICIFIDSKKIFIQFSPFFFNKINIIPIKNKCLKKIFSFFYLKKMHCLFPEKKNPFFKKIKYICFIKRKKKLKSFGLT